MITVLIHRLNSISKIVKNLFRNQRKINNKYWQKTLVLRSGWDICSERIDTLPFKISKLQECFNFYCFYYIPKYETIFNLEISLLMFRAEAKLNTPSRIIKMENWFCFVFEYQMRAKSWNEEHGCRVQAERWETSESNVSTGGALVKQWQGFG